MRSCEGIVTGVLHNGTWAGRIGLWVGMGSEGGGAEQRRTEGCDPVVLCCTGVVPGGGMR